MTSTVRRSRDVDALVALAREGDPRAVARLVSLVEDGDERLPALAAILAPYSGRAQVIGLTGAPGVGKSTLTSALVAAYRGQGRRVGVLAVDPSSPFTGGAILGDRVRMQDHATDAGVFIRSMSSRGHLGGLAAATPQAVRVLDAAGCDIVLVETVGVGQAEVEVASLADTTLVLVAPGMGDAIQAVKAGILEIADIFVVNKADREGADAAVRDLRGMLALGERAGSAGRTAADGWRPPVLKVVAERGDGVDEVVAAIAAHHEQLLAQGELAARRQRRTAAEIEHIALGLLRARLDGLPSATALPAHAAQVVAGRTDPYAAARALLAAVTGWPSAADATPGSTAGRWGGMLAGMSTAAAAPTAPRPRRGEQARASGAPLTVDAITVAYGGPPVLRDVSVTARPGQILAVTGPSGAGKSTLLNAMAALVRPARGVVRLGEEVLRNRDQAVRRGLVLVPQDNGLAPILTASENIQVVLVAGKVPPPEARRRTVEALEWVGLAEQANQLVEELSGGQQQRTALARGLALRGDVLLADEVTSELDAQNRQRVVELLRAEAERGAVVVFATHDPDAAAACDAELHLSDGTASLVR